MFSFTCTSEHRIFCKFQTDHIKRMMRGNAYGLLFLVVFVWVSFAFAESSVVTFHTQKGCNATLLCHQSGNVTWLNTSTAQKIEGPRFHTSAFGFFSTLLITDVSKNDRSNITCVGKEFNLTINFKVCLDEWQSHDCVTDIANNPGSCNGDFMIKNCKKSCGLCPDCQETVLPSLPPTTEGPQVATSTMKSSSSSSASSTQDTRNLMQNSGVPSSSGFQSLFAFICAIFSIFGIMFQTLV